MSCPIYKSGFILVPVLFLLIALFGCDQKQEKPVKVSETVPTHTIANISDEKLAINGWVVTTIKVKVSPTMAKETLEKLLKIILVNHYERITPLGKAQAFTIKAYYDNDHDLKNEIGLVAQVPPHRIAFEYGGVTTYDREEVINYNRERTKEENERDAYVGKVAAELVKEAEKIRDRR